MKIRTLKQKLQKTSKTKEILVQDNKTTYRICGFIYDKERKACYLTTVKVR